MCQVNCKKTELISFEYLYFNLILHLYCIFVFKEY